MLFFTCFFSAVDSNHISVLNADDFKKKLGLSQIGSHVPSCPKTKKSDTALSILNRITPKKGTGIIY